MALDRASALLVGARLDVQSVSMAVPRWSDFVLLHRVKSDGGWQVSGELQSSDARWLKTAEVVLAPRTAKSQTVTVRTNVTLVDAVSLRSVVVRVSHLVRSMPDPRSLVSTALLQPIVVESREDEAALVSMADLGALGTSLDSSAVWSEYWSVDVEVRGRDMDTSLSALVFDGVQADVRTRAGGRVSNVSNVALSTLASNGSDGSAAGLLQVYPVASFSGVFRGSLVLVFREKRNAAQRVEVVRPLAISWRRRDLDLSVALRSMVFVNETVSLPPRQLVFVFLDRASALLVDARLDVQSVSMAVPRWSDFVLLHRVKSDGGWQVSGELQSSDARWLKTAEVVLAPRTAKSQTVTVWTNVTLVDAVSLRSVVVRVSHLVRSMPDPRSLVSTALLQPIVVESREDEAALVSMADLGALGTSLDSSAVWSEYWSVDVEVRGRGMDTSLSALVFDGVQADVRTRAGGSVSNVSNVALSTLASNGSDGSAAGLLQVYPVASFSGVCRGSLVLVFREKRNAAQRVEVVRPLAISWRRRDLDLSVALRSMVFVNETCCVLDRASALLVDARLDVQSVSMALPRWSDFVLLHRVKSDGGWQVSGELQSSDARWLKTAEVVLAPRTAKSQTVTVWTNVTLVDAVSLRSVVVRVSHLVRSMPDPRSLVSTALLQPIVVESREDEAALVSMADLGALGTSLDSSAVWSEYWSVDVEVRGRDMDTSLSALVFDGVQADVRTRAGGSVSNVSNVALSTLASNGSDGSAAGLLQVYPVASFSGVFRGSLVLVFREKRNAAQRVEVVRPLAISWRRRDLDLSVALRSMVFVNETVSLPPRQLVFVFLDHASALLVDARLDVQSVSMAVPRWSDFVLLHRVKSDGGWQVSGELQSSDARWLKTAEVVLAPRTAKSQTVTVWTNVTLVDAVSLRSVVVRVSHLVRSMPDPRSLVSTALLQPIVVESREDEAALVSMADLGALGTSLDSSAVWSEYWSVDVEVRGRDMDTSLSALVFDGVQADVRTRAGGSVSNVSNVALSTLASNGSDGSAAGLLQVYPVASFSGVFRGSLVLVFREKRNAAQRVEVVRPLAISWRRRDLDLSVALRSMVFVNETVSLPPRQLVSVALDRASALLVDARLDVQSVSMAVPRWSDFVLLHRVKSDGGWQVSGELQSSDARWLKTAEVVLAPRTAKSQTVTVWTNVTLVDAVSLRSVVVRVSHLVRSMPDPRSLVSTALLQPIVVESREDEAALVSMADLGALGTSLDSSAVWSEYWSVDVEVRGRDMDTSLSALVFDGVQADVRTRAGGSVSNVSNVALSTLASNGSDGSAAGLLQVYPVASFSGVFRGSLVLVFREKRNAAQRVEVVRPLAISWRRRDLDLSVALRSMVFVNETVSLPPRQLVSVALDRASALLVDARLDVQSVSMAVPRWSDFVLLHRVKSDGGWQVSGELQSSDARWLKTAEVVLAPRTAKSQTVTVWTNVTLVDAVSLRSVVVRVSHLVRSMPDPRSLVSTALLQPIVVESREDEAALVSMADLGALGTSLDSSAVWSEYWSVDVEVRGRDMDTSLSALVFDGVQADVRTRAGGSVSNVSNVALSTLASNGSDGSAAGLLQVYPVASFSGVFRGSLVLVFREKRNAAQRVEVVRPLAISWRRRDLDLSVALRSMVFVNETVSLPPRQLVSVALDRASALLVDARLDVQSVSMAVPRWSDFVLLHRVKSDGGWQVSGELQSSDARWLKTAEVVLAPRTAKSQTVTVWTNVTLVDAVSLRSVVVRVSHLVRSMPDPRSLVSTALLQPIVVESREDEAALVSMADLGALGTSLDSSAVWSEYWSVDVEVRGRDMDTSLSALVFDGVQADVRTRAGGSVSNVSNVALSTLASNGSDGSAAGLLQVYPVASFSGVFRGSLVLVFREKRNAAQRVEVVRPLAISWRRRDLDLSVALRSMVFVNETVSLPPRQLVSVALDRASALLVDARLDVQSVSMAVPRWSDFVLLHRVKSDGGWQVSGELQSSDARWLKTAEVVLAPRTAKSQTVTVWTNVTLVDAVSLRSVVVRVSHLVRSMPDPRSLVSTALLQPIVVESREDEAALVSMADLGALGTSLDSSAVWSEYWSVDVEVRGRDMDTSLSALVFDGVQADVRTRAGGSVSNVSNVALSTLASNGSDGSAAGLLQVYPVASFSGVFRGSLVLVFREKRNAAQRVEVVRPLAISWRRRDLDLSVALRSMVFVNETVSLPPRQLVSVALDRASALLVGARLDVQSVSMAVPRWSDFVLLHRVKSDGGWQVSGELQSSDARWLKTAEVVLAPRTAKSQTVTVWTNVTLVDAVSLRSVVVRVSHLVRSMPDPRSLVSTALLQPIVVESREDEAALVSMADLGALGTSLDSSAVWSEYWSVDVEVRGRDMDTSLSALVFDGVQADVRTRAGGSVSNVSNVALSTLASNGSDGSAAGLLQVYPVASFSGVFRGSLVLVFREKRNAAQRVEVVRPLAISWRRRDLDLSVALRSMVFVNETVSLPPRQLVSVALDRASALLVGARLDVQSVSMAVPRWSDFVLLHRVKSDGGWQVSGELQSSDARWLKTAEVVLAPRTAKSQTVTVWTNVTLVDAVSCDPWW
ncbi:hypothetical protein PInf_007983 [Phytophthora infestans]|nr:hypothetical protein PInf_007983 [Phytophthora infestans]